MKNLRMAIWMVAGGLLLAAPAFPQGDKAMGQGRAVVTILPKGHGEMPAGISQQDLNIKVNGKPAVVTRWRPLRGPDDRLELVLLIDSSARNSWEANSATSNTSSTASRRIPRPLSHT